MPIDREGKTPLPQNTQHEVHAVKFNPKDLIADGEMNLKTQEGQLYLYQISATEEVTPGLHTATAKYVLNEAEVGDAGISWSTGLFAWGNGVKITLYPRDIATRALQGTPF